MKKQLLIAAFGFACIALDASAQVGLGGGAVGALGRKGPASATGGLGAGIRSGATARGAELRDTGQLDSTPQPRASGNVAAGIDANASGSGVRTETNAGGSAGTPSVAPPISGSVWGGAQTDTKK